MIDSGIVNTDSGDREHLPLSSALEISQQLMDDFLFYEEEIDAGWTYLYAQNYRTAPTSF